MRKLTLREARERGNVDEFVRQHQTERGEMKCLERTVEAMARKPQSGGQTSRRKPRGER